MALDNRSQMIEDLLDEGLRKYGTVAPRPGIEGRVIANLRLEQDRAVVRFWQRWSVRVGAMVAVAALALLIVWKPSVKAPEIPHAVSTVEPPAVNVVAPQRADSARQQFPPKEQKTMATVVVAREGPEQFPSPRPLSSQEKLLLSYVNQAPREEVVATASGGRGINELYVQDLDVAPLNVDEPRKVTQQQ